MTHPIKSPKKLIEVALPLDAINVAAAREKSIRHGHPSTLHLWWARRPLAAARAVIFAQLVNDPGYQQGKGFKYGVNKEAAAIERKRLFGIIEDLVKWENTTNEEVLERARVEIRRSWREVCELNKDHPQAAELFNPDKLPGLHDPFAGGGTIPLEAQRLGLEAYASDLNPVAVLINKAMIEIPPKFAGRPPVNPESRAKAGLRHWKGAEGLAEDVRYYGAWMRAEAEKRIGHLYPKVEITGELAKDRPDLKGLVGQKLTVIAWIWARTVKSPNPAFSHVEVPLASTFVLSTKEGKDAYVDPIVAGDRYRFLVKLGRPPKGADDGTKAARGANFICLVSRVAIDPKYIYGEARAGRMGTRLMAVVAEGTRGRIYLEPTLETEKIAKSAIPAWKPDLKMPDNPRWFSPPLYGLTTYGDVFTPRQLVTLLALGELVNETRQRITHDARAALDPDKDTYADAVCTYLALAIGKFADNASSLCSWHNGAEHQKIRATFGRQALPMTWDYAEGNPFSDSTGNFFRQIELIGEVLSKAFPQVEPKPSIAQQFDAQYQALSNSRFVSTDPPYYDNIGYADLSDFFYVWLRRSLRGIYPELFATMAVPKAEELVATPYRHGSKEAAERFFLEGMTAAMHRLAEQAHPAAPITIYYAFKQSETKTDAGTSSTGWETFLEAVHRAGLAVTGTWPMRTELSNRMVGSGTNALASSIVLVCRPRPADAPMVSRREFLRELNAVLPEALAEMTKGAGEDRSPVAPVDLSQAIIGPGMAIYSKYAAVLEADGSTMPVKTALQFINRFLAEDDFDHDTQFCLHWFDQYGWNEGPYGEADVLARAKATSVGGLVEAGVLQSAGGKVKLLRTRDYPDSWDPSKDNRIPVWEALHQLIRVFRREGESAAGCLLAMVKSKSEAIRQLSYRLYTLSERKGESEEARGYNDIVQAWNAIDSAANEAPPPKQQLDLFGGKR